MEYAYRPSNMTRIKVTNLQGSFYDHLTGEEIRFTSTDHFPADATVGVKEYWELQGEDGQTYRLLDSGEIQDEVGEMVGEFDPHADPDPDRHEDEPGDYGDWDHEGRTANDDRNELHTEQEKKALVCPNCGSHTLRAFDAEGGEAEVKCLTCGNEFKRRVFKNPEAKVAMDGEANPGPMVRLVGDVLKRLGLETSVTPELNNEIYAYVKEITDGSPAAASDQVGGYQALVEAIASSMQEEQARAGDPGYIDTQMDRTPGDIYPADVGVPAGSEGYYRNASLGDPGYNDTISYPQDPNQQAEVRQLMQQIAQAQAAGDRMSVIPLQQRLEMLLGGSPNLAPLGGWQKHAPGKEHMKGVSPKRNRQYEHVFESCRKTHPDWSVDKCKELAARTVNKQRSEKGETKSSGNIPVAPGFSDFIDKGVSGQLTTCPTCGSQNYGYDASGTYHCQDCGATWNPFKQAAGTGKWQPGTRIKMTHPTFKGQKGSILEFKDRHDELGEESYNILLDSGLEIEDCPESHFDKHKSAGIVNNEGLTDTVENFFLESMVFEANPYDEPPSRDVDYGPDPPQELTCPDCGGSAPFDGEFYQCNDCGYTFTDPTEADSRYWQNREQGAGYQYPPEEDPFTIWPGRHPMGSTRQADKSPPGAWPASDSPKNPSGLPEESGDVKNNTPEHYDPKATDPRYDEPDLSGGDVECPLCHSNASSKGAFGPREYYGCGSCGMEFSLPNSDEAAKWGVDDPDELFGQDKPSKRGSGWDPRQPTPQYSPTPALNNMFQPGDKALMNRPLDNQLPTSCPQCGQMSLKGGVCTNCGFIAPALAPPQDPTNSQGRMASVRDSIGNELKAGNWYILHSSDYKVPDVIKIVELNDGRIVAHFETDHNGSFPLQIESSQADKYSFDPYDFHKDPEVIDDKAIQSESGWKTARRNFSQREQQDLIDENLDGRARNFEKLNLDGTHYHVHSSLVDENFLWQ